MSDNVNLKLQSKCIPVTKINFGIMSSDEILKNSCIPDDIGITIPESYDNGFPKRNGLSDSRMGVIDNNLICGFCGKDMNLCEGHFGHIKLAEPVFNNCYLPQLKKIIECICINCSKLKYNFKLSDDIIVNNKGIKRLDKIRAKIKNLSVCKLDK